MLRAIDTQGYDYIAPQLTELIGADIRKLNLHCPECGEFIVFTRYILKVDHFRHFPGSIHSCRSEESEEHKLMKWDIFRILQKDRLNYDVKIERKVENQVADVYCRRGNLTFVVECQVSGLSNEVFTRRSDGWKEKGVYHIWIFGQKWFNSYTLDNAQIVHKKGILRNWKYLTLYEDGVFISVTPKNGIQRLYNPIFKPYLSYKFKNKSLIMVET